MCGPGFRRLGEWTGTKPAARHVLYRDGDLELCRCSWAFGPGTFGGPLLAPVSTAQPRSARCKRRPLVSARSRVSAEDRRRPLLSARDDLTHKDVMRVTSWQQDRIGGNAGQSAGRVAA